jgi:hypothetical protein
MWVLGEGYAKITQRTTRLNLNIVIISLRLIQNKKKG